MQTDFGGAKDSPHPLPVPVRLSYEDAYAEPLPIPSSILPRPGSHSRWDPASPTALSRLLSAISPRESPAPSPAPDGAFDADEDLSSPTIGGSNDSDSSSSPALGLSGTEFVAEAVPVVLADGDSPISRLPSGPQETKTTVGAAEDEDEADLRLALEGVWRMWKKGKRKTIEMASSGDSEAKEAFLRAARAVVDRA